MREALRALDLPEKLNPPRRILSRISARKNSGRDPEEAESDSVGAQTFARVAERYHEILRAAHALDFDDLLLRAVALFEQDEHVRESYRRRFHYVLVDEYQDTNRAQYELVRLLVGPAREPDGGGGRGPVDLLLARGGHPEHPRLRARLPGRARPAPGGELPLDPGHPRRRGGRSSPTT